MQPKTKQDVPPPFFKKINKSWVNLQCYIFIFIYIYIYSFIWAIFLQAADYYKK